MIKVLTDTINYLTTTTLLSNIRGDKLSFDAHNMNDKTNILMSHSLLTKTTEIFQLCVMSLIMIIGNTWLVASRAVMLVTTSPVSRHTTLSIVPIFHMIYRFPDGPGLGRYTHVSHFTTVYTLKLIWWGFLPHFLSFSGTLHWGGPAGFQTFCCYLLSCVELQCEKWHRHIIKVL